MKERFFKKIKRFLIILLILFVLIGGYVVIRYTQDEQGFMNELDGWYKYAQNLAGKYYGIESKDEKIDFPEDEPLTQAQKYYFFRQLSEPAKIIYVSIEKNIDKIIAGEDDIPLPSSLNKYAKEKGKEYIAQEFQSAWDAFVTDKSEYFYIDSSKVCMVTQITTRASFVQYEFKIGKGGNKTYYIDEFDSKEEVEEAKKEIEKKADKVLAGATGTNYDKIKYVHDWIVENTKYDAESKLNTANIYGCLVNGRALCEGYARTFKYLMDRLNIPCILVSGDAIDEKGKTERHAWNYVYIYNNWYAIDTTWDDPIIIGNGTVGDKIKYKYFLKGSKTMYNDHITSGQITKDGKIFEYPKLFSEDFE